MISCSPFSDDFTSAKHIFFVGIAGFGMSALAQYLKGTGKEVSGSDRNFNYNQSLDIKQKLECEGIKCYLQDGSGITPSIDLVITTTIVSDTIPEILKCKELGLKIVTRSSLLSSIVASKKTISVGGTSGKSTTTAMIYHILNQCGMKPSVITGAGLVGEMEKGSIGNCVVGEGEWLVVEGDESDGGIMDYRSEIGVVLNISKDHKEVEELRKIFEEFQRNSRVVVRNKDMERDAGTESTFQIIDDDNSAKQFSGNSLKQHKFSTEFKVNQTSFYLKMRGLHNLQNALASIAVCSTIIPCLESISKALHTFEGVDRRCEWIGEKNGVTLVDDYAHNPAKIKAMLQSMRAISKKLLVWFQPHGFASLKFMMDQFAEVFSQELRQEDEVWINEVYVAAGSDAVKSVSSMELVEKINKAGRKAHFMEERSKLAEQIKPKLENETIVLLMGARDTTLSQFAKEFFASL